MASWDLQEEGAGRLVPMETTMSAPGVQEDTRAPPHRRHPVSSQDHREFNSGTVFKTAHPLDSKTLAQFEFH